LPKTINGYVWFDDQQRAFLVERIANPDGPEGVKRVFLFQYKGKRNLTFEDTSIPAALDALNPKEKSLRKPWLLLSFLAPKEAAMKSLLTMILAISAAVAGRRQPARARSGTSKPR